MSLHVKMIISSSLLLLSAVGAIIQKMPWNWLICVSLAFSFLGDAFLSHYKPITNGIKDTFLIGMGMYAVAQILYIWAFAYEMRHMPLLKERIPGIPYGIELLPKLLPVLLLTGAVLWALFIFRSKPDKMLMYGTLIYSLLVYGMVEFAICAAFTGRRFELLLPLGAVLFAISDTLIAAHDFARLISDDVLYENLMRYTYFSGQTLILLGTLLL